MTSNNPDEQSEQELLDYSNLNTTLNYSEETQLQPYNHSLSPHHEYEMLATNSTGASGGVHGQNSYFNSYNHSRVVEIDSQIDHDFQCYQCWVWFSMVFCMIFLLMTTASMINPYLEQYMLLFIFDLIFFGFTGIGNYFGLSAIRYKSMRRHQIFKFVLLILILFNIARIAHFQMEGVFGFIINMGLYSTALRIDKLLKERKELIGEENHPNPQFFYGVQLYAIIYLFLLFLCKRKSYSFLLNMDLNDIEQKRTHPNTSGYFLSQ